MLRIDINLIFTVINVLILCAAVRIFLWKPIHKILAERQAMVDQSLEEAARSQAEAQALAEEHRATMVGIEQEKASVLADAKKQAQAESVRIVEDAKARADGIVRDAEAEANTRKDAILRQAKGEITELIVAASAKVAGVPLSQAANSGLYDEFLKAAGEESSDE